MGDSLPGTRKKKLKSLAFVAIPNNEFRAFYVLLLLATVKTIYLFRINLQLTNSFFMGIISCR